MKKEKDYQNSNNAKENKRAQIPERCRVGYQRYTVAAGDTMEKIARQFNVSVDFLIAENPHISDPDKIFPGDVLCVPVKPGPGEIRVPESCPLGYERYTVKQGDTVFKIAQERGVLIDLISLNNPHIPDFSVIFPGDVLCVPVALTFPYCQVLKPMDQVNRNAFGSAMVQRLLNGQHQLVITGASLPEPSTFGNFDEYEGFVGIPGIGGYGFRLTRVSERALGLWTGSIILTPLLSIGNQVYIIPSNSKTGASGRPILGGVFTRND
ncbi:LysM peptidoglycan-binding domain-containing protein [Caloramator mitchellensis]|uniref:LysM peptidoglycan-binding domain-containing protein n=1 Tax=Caloramator mitchellensis TaxID=908809 RepID=UPI001FA6B6AB|nr:LysM peptidoglycan-binding domain-containing protein [Caloramator mitchellensis]